MSSHSRVREISQVTEEEEAAVLREQARRRRTLGIILAVVAIGIMILTMVIFKTVGMEPFTDRDMFRSV